MDKALRQKVFFVVAIALGLVPGLAAAAPGDYTDAQATAGKMLYDTNCASCHMADLSGGAGPALTGKKFVSYLDFTHITAAQLLSFITAQMPANAPGSLKPAQYRQIMAYILGLGARLVRRQVSSRCCFSHLTRTEMGIPRLVIRLMTLQAILASVCWRDGVRA